MIQIENLHKTFGQQHVLRGVSLRVEPGEFLALVGMSGSGKSLLLRHIVRLFAPDEGRVLVEGRDVAGLPARELEELRGRIGYVFQNGALFDSMTVYDNVAFPLRERGVSAAVASMDEKTGGKKTRLREPKIRERVMRELEAVGLADAGAKFPAQLSGGMLKRVALARTLVRQPEIILFDEPTTGLDPLVVNSVLALFDAVHRQRGLTGIIVSHEIPEIFRIVQKVAMLHEGKIVAVETPERLQTSANPILRQFVNGDPEGPIAVR